MKFSDLDLSKSYTYADYLKWTFEERVELIKGKIFEMSPAPSANHQRISSRIHTSLGYFLRNHPCEVFSAPFDVRLPRKSKDNEQIITVVQPDICVICNGSKVDEKGCLGAPDIIIEILSPANNKKELKYKHELYEEAGVLEYWIVNPSEKAVQIFTLNDNKLLASGYLYSEDVITTPILPGFTLPLSEVFHNI